MFRFRKAMGKVKLSHVLRVMLQRMLIKELQLQNSQNLIGLKKIYFYNINSLCST